MAKQDIKLTIGTEYNDEGLRKLDLGLKSSAKKAKDATSGIQKVTSALGSLDGKAGQVASKIGGILESFARGGVWGVAIAGITTAFSIVIDKIQKVREEGKKAAEELTDKFKNAFKIKLDKINADVNLRSLKMKEESSKESRVGTAAFAYEQKKKEVELESKQKIETENMEYQRKVQKIKTDYSVQNMEETSRANEELKGITDAGKRKTRIEDRDSVIKSNQNMMERDLKIAEQEHLKRIDEIRFEALKELKDKAGSKYIEKDYQIIDKDGKLDLDASKVILLNKELAEEIDNLEKKQDTMKKQSLMHMATVEQYQKDIKSYDEFQKNPLTYVIQNDKDAREKVLKQKSWYEAYRQRKLSDSEYLYDVQNVGLKDNLTLAKNIFKKLLGEIPDKTGEILRKRIENTKTTSPLIDKDGKINLEYIKQFNLSLKDLGDLIKEKKDKLVKDNNEVVNTQVEFRKFRDEYKDLEEKLRKPDGSGSVYDEQIRLANEQKKIKDSELAREITDKLVEERNKDSDALKKEMTRHTSLLTELSKNTSLSEEDADVKRIKQIPEEIKRLTQDTTLKKKENVDNKNRLSSKKSELESMLDDSTEEDKKIIEERIKLINGQIKLLDRQNKVEDDILKLKIKNLDFEKKRLIDNLNLKKNTAKDQRQLAEIEQKIDRLTRSINEAENNRNLPVNQEARQNNFNGWKLIQINKAKDELKAVNRQNANMANAVGRAKQLWDRTHDRKGNVLKSATAQDLQELAQLQQFNNANADVEKLTGFEQSELEKLKKMNPKLMSQWHKNRLTALQGKEDNVKAAQKKNDELKNAQKQKDELVQQQRIKAITSLKNIELKLNNLGL